MTFTLGIIIGLVVGWNLFPQPVWIEALYKRIVAGLQS